MTAVAKAVKGRRFTGAAGHGKALTLRADHPAVVQGRTLFPSTRASGYHGRILKSGHNSRKIGGMVTKGPWAGMPIFTLTLEERATCPRSCAQWANCYGNHMHMAKRYQPGRFLEQQIPLEIAELARQHPKGFVVRLHVLGDFYSLEYVQMWAAMVGLYPELRVFGYTAHQPGTPIGDYLTKLRDQVWDRFAIRTSNSAGLRGAWVAESPDAAAGSNSIPCPAQTSKTSSCGTCALCWGTTRPIVFLEH